MLTDMTKEQMKPFPSYLWTDVMYEPDLKFFLPKKRRDSFLCKIFWSFAIRIIIKMLILLLKIAVFEHN